MAPTGAFPDSGKIGKVFTECEPQWFAYLLIGCVDLEVYIQYFYSHLLERMGHVAVDKVKLSHRQKAIKRLQRELV